MKTLAEQRASAIADLAAADAALTDADKAEQTERDEIAALREQAREKADAKRELDVARRLDAAIGNDGDPREFRPVVIKGYPDTFILRRNGKAHATWDRGCIASQSNDKHKRVEMVDVRRKYALASVVDWNGETNFDASVKANGPADRLDKYLTEHPGMATSIVAVAVELNGALVEERKSAG